MAENAEVETAYVLLRYLCGDAAFRMAARVALSVSKSQIPTSKNTTARSFSLLAAANKAVTRFGRLGLFSIATSLSISGVVLVKERTCLIVGPKSEYKVAVGFVS